MSGGQHRVDEVTRTESRRLDRKNNPRIAAHCPPKETAGLRNAGVCAKGIKKELKTLDVADFVRDVEKSSSHQLSQIEIASDKPCSQQLPASWWPKTSGTESSRHCINQQFMAVDHRKMTSVGRQCSRRLPSNTCPKYRDLGQRIVDNHFLLPAKIQIQFFC